MSLKPIASPLAAFIIGCLGTAFAAHADITVGVSWLFSGPNATYEDQYWRGANQAALNKAGVKEVMCEGLSRGEKDFSALMTKIRSIDPQVVYFGGCHPEAGPLVRQMCEQGLKAKFFSDDCIVTEELVNVGRAATYRRRADDLWPGPEFDTGGQISHREIPRQQVRA